MVAAFDQGPRVDRPDVHHIIAEPQPVLFQATRDGESGLPDVQHHLPQRLPEPPLDQRPIFNHSVSHGAVVSALKLDVHNGSVFEREQQIHAPRLHSG